MSENMQALEELKKVTKHRLQHEEAWYVVFSQNTHMPYVECDEETYDDEVLVYFSEDQARAEVEKLVAEGEATQVLKVENSGVLPFCVNLFFMGVNCIFVGRGTDEEVRIQLNEFVQRNPPKEDAEEAAKIQNPELHLTALYFVQELRKQGTPELTDKLKELDEELKVHFDEGRYIVATKDDQLCQLQKGKDTYQPLFTDYQEFWKFNRGKDFKAAVLPAENLPKILKPGTKGIVINPIGVNLMLNVALQNKKEL